MTKSMKAAVLDRWKNIDVREIKIPDYGPDDVLIRVLCAGICGSDVHIYNGNNPIAITPVVQGHEFMGEVAAVGSNSAHIHVGQRVVVQPLIFCGKCTPCQRNVPHVCKSLIVIGVNANGGFSSYVSVPADTIFPIAETLPNETAVLAEPFSIAYHTCCRGELISGERVLVIGAGPIGLYSAIVAREFGAKDIVISEPNTERRRFAEEFGLSTIDPTDVSALEQLAKISCGDGHDMVVETSGVDAGLDFAVNAVSVRGRIVTLGFPAKNYANYNITKGIVKEVTLIGSRVCTRDEFGKTISLLEGLHASGKIDFSKIATIPRPLSQLEASIIDVGEAHECAKILIKPE